MVKEKQTEIKGDGKDQATVFVYMNGSDLESEDGEATEDLCEMLAANISSQVNVLVETIGTKSWSKRLEIASDHTQRYKVEAGNLVLVDDSLGQLDCTSPDTLADFISWGAENYPANRYILIFWDHGAGPVYGFGYDEHQSEDSVLTIDEIQTAFRDRNNSLQTELSRYKEKSATFEEEMKERDEKLTKMKNLYNEQIDELQAAFREKKESDHEAEMERMKNIYESMLKEIQETFQEKLKQLQDELASANEQVQLYKTGMESHEAELEKMKKLYDEQLLEVQTAFREKNAELQGQIDRFKAQLGSLLAD